MEILNERRNPDEGKRVVVDICSDNEFDEVLDEIRKEDLPTNKRIWLWKVDDYSRTDLEFCKPKRRTHQSVGFGTKAPNELKSHVSFEYLYYIVKTYKVKVPTR